MARIIPVHQTDRMFKFVKDNNLMDENKYHKENEDILLHTSKETGLEVHVEKSEYAYTYIHIRLPEYWTKS
jgi:hypothetical protein